MPARHRTRLARAAAERNQEQLARLGVELRAARVRRRVTQDDLAARAGLSQAAVSRAERGRGGSMTIDAWQRLAVAVGMPLRISFGRDPLADTADAAHLAIQELVLAVARGAGFSGRFELATRPTQPARSIDVSLIHEARRSIVVAECWNTFGDVGAGARSSARKLAEARDLAVSRWGEAPHRVGLLWVVRASAANRALVARYPEVFASQFPGSSADWVRTLTDGAPPPDEPGLVWCDARATRLFAWRRPRVRRGDPAAR